MDFYKWVTLIHESYGLALIKKFNNKFTFHVNIYEKALKTFLKFNE